MATKKQGATVKKAAVDFSATIGSFEIKKKKGEEIGNVPENVLIALAQVITEEGENNA